MENAGDEVNSFSAGESNANLVSNNAVIGSGVQPNNSKKWIFVLGGVVILLFILIIIGIFIFGSKGVIKDDLKVINCGSTPPDFSPSKRPDSKTKNIFVCGTESLIDCSPSITEYQSDRSDNTYLRVVGREGGDCVVQYEWGEKGIECKYTREQIKDIYDAAKKEGQEWALSFGFTFALGMEILGYSEGKKFNQQIGEGSAPCEFYKAEKKEYLGEPKKEEGDNVDADTIAADKGVDSDERQRYSYWESGDVVEIREKDMAFEIYSIRCHPYCEPGKEYPTDCFDYIYLSIENIGILNISKDDLYVFEIDGERGRGGIGDTDYMIDFVLRTNSTKSFSIPIGGREREPKKERTVKIGLSENGIFETKVKCIER